MVPRISPAESYSRLEAGKSLLVCAYASDDHCKNIRLAGALLPSEFTAKVQTLPKDQEIIFYCA
ncbi:MAG TPA: ArsR family transcriptional regulator [Thermodesulfobacteriota bacterium]|nr:ArsR family transcriptional regulator [Thermodesulfobacteriota bacterium]